MAGLRRRRTAGRPAVRRRIPEPGKADLGRRLLRPRPPGSALGDSDLEYENSWDSFAEKIEKAPFQAGHGFEAPVWASLTKELPGEFENVQGVWGLISNLQSVFGVSSTSAQVNLKKIALAIEEETAPPAHGEVAGWWLELAANLLSTASYYSFGIEGEIVRKSAGTLSGALFIAAQMIYGPQGAPAAETFKLETTDFASELAETYLDASKGLGLIGEILVSDYGKLTAVKEGGLLGINEKTLAKLEEALGPGSQSWSYEKLLPTSYEPVTLKTGLNLDKVLPENATEYLCTWSESYGLYSEYKPFENTSNHAQLRTEEPRLLSRRDGPERLEPARQHQLPRVPSDPRLEVAGKDLQARIRKWPRPVRALVLALGLRHPVGEGTYRRRLRLTRRARSSRRRPGGLYRRAAAQARGGVVAEALEGEAEHRVEQARRPLQGDPRVVVHLRPRSPRRDLDRVFGDRGGVLGPQDEAPGRLELGDLVLERVSRPSQRTSTWNLEPSPGWPTWSGSASATVGSQSATLANSAM